MDERIAQCTNWDIYHELMNEECNCPNVVLGLHDVYDDQVIRTFKPGAHSVFIVNPDNGRRDELEKLTDQDFYGKYLEGKPYGRNYLLEVHYNDGSVVTLADPYSYDQIISDFDLHLFAESNHYDIYEKLGAHPMEINGVWGTHFAVWAPNARRVSVVGDFNCWDGRLHPMRLLGSSGVHEIFIPGVYEGAIYKYQIKTRGGEFLYKTDPYGNCAQLRPDNASVVVNLNRYFWQDGKWMEKRANTDRMEIRRDPMTIYEVHLGSWKKPYGDDNGFLNYRQLADELGEYLIYMGYTHVELIGIAEHPFDGSWGYQVTGYYAPTRRYGMPDDFMYFIDHMHSLGIAVILDWVPAHFPKDANGLGRFDGQPLYENPDTRKGEHPHWGTYVFNYEKTEVANFLVANALFWIEKFHIDGLRVDAVASMLYLDYGREAGQWVPNKFGGKENLEVIALLQHVNKVVGERNPGALMIAEESTAWAGVTSPVELGGLGFLFKWNMGWMNDFLEYMKLDPYFRQFNHNKITFSMMYAYSENFIQVLSHDEVVHGKCSMIQKMPGLYDDKFANLRAAYGFMWGHPGKKLLFMGQEFAQWNEWSEARGLDWYLADEEKNRGMMEWVRALNHMYQAYPAMYYNDYDPMGFEWMDCDNYQDSIVSFVRRGDTKERQLLFVINFTPMWKDEYRIPVPCEGKYKQILTSDSKRFGGYGTEYTEPVVAEEVPYKGKDYSINVKVPPLSCMIFEYDFVEPVTEEPEEEKAEEKACDKAEDKEAKKEAKAETKKEPAKKKTAKAKKEDK